MNPSAAQSLDPWEQFVMAVDDVTQRMSRILGALNAAKLPFALVGGQAVAVWVATKDPDAVRVTKDVDILIRREDLPAVRKAALSVGMEYFEVLGVGMFLDREDPHPRRAVHLLWAGEKVRPEYVLPSPSVDDVQELGLGRPVISLVALVRMKLMANRDHDRTHLRDMIDVDLVSRDMLAQLPAELATRLDALLTEAGR
jgi:hypothetical protein